VSTSTTSPAADARVRLLGIRHHGPGSARAVRRALETAPPDLVLVEGPADADPVLGLAGDPAMDAPVALLGYALDHPERAVFHPLASFSPEWVALTWALGAQVPVRCIDLPTRVVLAPPPADAPRAAAVRARPLDPIGDLARAAGYDDPERWWEDAVEHRLDGGGDALDAPFPAIAEAMAAVRREHEPGGAPSDPVERRREAHMRQAIRAALREGHRDVAVVCGAWHVPALAAALPGSSAAARRGGAAADAAELRGLPKVKAAVTWVPWTHRRLASATGYGAGVTAPGWYHHLYEHAGPDVIARWFAEMAQVLRAADHAASAADVVEATRLADALAALRGRPLAGLAEVDDAARAVFGHGGDTPMRLVADELVVGNRIGRVPPATPMVPLARHLAAEQRRCRLRPAAGTKVLELDLRRPLDLERSRLVHRLALVGVPWGREADGRRSAGTFRETWQLRWEPELEVRVIEASALGTTVPAAAAAAVLQRAARANGLGELTVLLEQVLLADLGDVVGEVLALVAERSAVASDVERLLESLPPLVRTARYGDVRGTSATRLDDVVAGVVSRAVAGLPAAATGLDEGSSASLAALVREAQAALSLLGHDGHLAALHAALVQVTAAPRVHGLLQGVATRLLADAGVLDATETERRVSRSLSGGTPPLEAAAFVEGFLGASAAVLVHDPLLLEVLDGWLASLAGDAFTDVLPLMRRTFGSFEPAERRAIGERIRTGEAPGTRRGAVELDRERVDAALRTVAQLLGVPT